jgi:hypothetical protein
MRPYDTATGVQIEEIIHDDDPKVSYLIKEKFPELHNSLCAWHKGKNIMKGFRAFQQILRRENPDAPSLICDIPAEKLKKHFYWVLNTAKSTTDLLKRWYNLAFHYSDLHFGCDEERCPARRAATTTEGGFTPTFHPLRPDDTMRLLNFLKETLNWKNVEEYFRVRFTTKVESWSRLIKKYATKDRFFKKSHHMRAELAVLDWNENVGHRKAKKTYGFRYSILEQLASTLPADFKQLCAQYEEHRSSTRKVVQELNESWFEDRPTTVASSQGCMCRSEKACSTNRCARCTAARRGCGPACACWKSQCYNPLTRREVESLFDLCLRFVTKDFKQFLPQLVQLPEEVRLRVIDLITGVSGPKIQSPTTEPNPRTAKRSATKTTDEPNKKRGRPRKQTKQS